MSIQFSSKQRSLPHQYASTELPLSVRLSAPNPSQMQTQIKCNAKRYKPISQHIKRISVTTETPEYDTQDQKKTSTSRRKKSPVTTREASKTAKESIPTKEKNNINARNVRFFQSLNSCLTDNTAKTLCCLPTTRRRGRRQTDGKRQRNAKINGRGMRK